MHKNKDKDDLIMDDYFEVLENIKQRIADSQYKVMTVANVARNILYWNIGKVIIEHSQWGNKFVENLSKDLKMEYPNSTGYTVRNLNYMKQFAIRIPDEEILHRTGAKISWKAIKLLIDKTDTTEEHIWYTVKCIENGWSSSVLAHQVESKLYVRQDWNLEVDLRLWGDNIR